MTWSVWTMDYPTLIAVIKRVVSLCLAGLMSSGCTTTRLNVNYKKSSPEMPITAEAGRGERLGYVTGESGGFGWSNCVNRAEMSLDEMVEAARALGADSIGEVRWDSTGTAQAGCNRKWTYAILWPILATPLFMNTRVEGVAYRKR